MLNRKAKGRIVERQFVDNGKVTHRMYGIRDIDMVNGRQVFPYDSYNKAMQEWQFIRFKQRNKGLWTWNQDNPKDAPTD